MRHLRAYWALAVWLTGSAALALASWWREPADDSDDDSPRWTDY